jgi:hypothetical protein
MAVLVLSLEVVAGLPTGCAGNRSSVLFGCTRASSPAGRPDTPEPVDAAKVLPDDRVTVWNPGLNAVGGIPHRTTVCARLDPSGGNDTRAIQDAIDSCPENQVVLLGPGTFTVTGEGLAIERSGITLRGSGPDRTRLVKPRGTNLHAIVFGHRWSKYTQPTDLAADARRGTRSLILTANPGLEVGELVLIDQLGDPRWTRNRPARAPRRRSTCAFRASSSSRAMAPPQCRGRRAGPPAGSSVPARASVARASHEVHGHASGSGARGAPPR